MQYRQNNSCSQLAHVSSLGAFRVERNVTIGFEKTSETLSFVKSPNINALSGSIKQGLSFPDGLRTAVLYPIPQFTSLLC